MNRVFSEIKQGNDSKRYEIKMVYSGLRIPEVTSWIIGHSQLFKRAYPTRQVNNIYFDTLNMAFRDDHIQGSYQRLKIRYRWYSNTWSTNNGQLEIKRKFGNLGEKEVFPIQAEINLTRLTWIQIHRRIHKELDPTNQLLINSTQPVLINSYQREYFINADGSIRITLDSCQTIFDQSFGFKPNISNQMPIRNDLVLEFKTDSSHHQEIADVLEEFPLYGSAHSKYLTGTEYDYH